MNGEGSSKETNHSNVSGRLPIAWAGTATVIAIALIGVIWDIQKETNTQLRGENQRLEMKNDELQSGLADLNARVGRLELQIEVLQRTVERQVRE